ncbi:hypothetical protein BU24DRAFT_427783 [Aaosphaeria arxii CBS 175.79]|uniref:FYVE-domain-containing protein n=1 Tax=Aaosphaeria arxii CBS 175.79 TaxID=1450172 RepID=A0A6A5XCF5_9PLEO|nr:uncharacterized protein BU24DRAFT_427783 [Aaosphaeria arxii CBS 175.79]KAF2010672.1 hypothetical protein BU24DRAFT_427783 [Aaosphaeria arxii CBS 175.79]
MSSHPHSLHQQRSWSSNSSGGRGDDNRTLLTSKALPPPPPDDEDGEASSPFPTLHRGSGSNRSSLPHNNHGVVASHFLAQHADTHGGQTWVDFLRESGPDANEGLGVGHNTTQRSEWPGQTTSASSSRLALPTRLPRASSTSSANSVERKRRLTAPESPGRQTSGRRTRASFGDATGGTQSDPIGPGNVPPTRNRLPRPPLNTHSPHPPRTSSVGGGRRQSNMSDIALPPWQADHEVNLCPVCGNQFTFWYRKHHCRKCGRVVCANCSPHRITIPRQFIVHPPSESFAGSNMVDLTGSDDDNQMSAFGPFRNPALGGGDIVRVCNPCVPDPNYSLPPQPPPYSTRPGVQPDVFPPQHTEARHSFPRGHRPSHSDSHAAAHDAYPRDGPPYQDRARLADIWVPTTSSSMTTSRQHQHNQHHHHPSPSHPNSAALGFLYHAIPNEPQQAPAPQHRRQIAEEDECPVCGFELPPRGPNGEETDREEHISSCILTFSDAPVSTPPTVTGTPNPPDLAVVSSAGLSSTSLPNPRVRGMSDAAGTPGSSTTSRNRMSLSARGMFPYVATEKDCVDEDGTTAECVICFEDFEAGDKMARLVCWCKFHEECIRQWWAKKGRGACPTHQLHE